MESSLVQSADAVTISLAGAFTFQDYGQWREIMDKAISTKQARHIVDITDVENIDSAGLGMLLHMRQQVLKHDANMFLRHQGDGEVKAMLTQSRFDTLIPFCED